MSRKTIYVPDMKKWEKFYKDMLSGKIPHSHYNTTHDMKLIPIENRVVKENDVSKQSNVKVNIVSPAQMALEQVKSELKREKKVTKRRNCPKPHHKAKKSRDDNIERDVFSKQEQ